MIKKIIQWMLPTSCILCLDKVNDDFDLCPACQRELPRIKQACFRCAFPIYNNLNSHDICGIFLQKPPPFDHTLALSSYEEPIITFINHLKFSGQLKYAKLLNQLFIHFLHSHQDYLMNLPEVIIPVPLHSDRLKERGFNQALELSRGVAKYFNIPILSHSCHRIRATTSQSLIAERERRKNLKNAFVINPAFKAKHIAIVDDVVTTGSTVAELSQIFKNHGVEQIDIWCYARTILQFPAQYT